MTGFRSPEEAAVVGFPAKYCRIVAVAVDAGAAYVLLDTGSIDQPYLYGVHCIQIGGTWQETSSGNGGGWSADLDGELGPWALWDAMPAGADRVRIEYGDEVLEQPAFARPSGRRRTSVRLKPDTTPQRG